MAQLPAGNNQSSAPEGRDTDERAEAASSKRIMLYRSSPESASLRSLNPVIELSPSGRIWHLTLNSKIKSDKTTFLKLHFRTLKDSGKSLFFEKMWDICDLFTQRVFLAVASSSSDKVAYQRFPYRDVLSTLAVPRYSQAPMKT